MTGCTETLWPVKAKIIALSVFYQRSLPLLHYIIIGLNSNNCTAYEVLLSLLRGVEAENQSFSNLPKDTQLASGRAGREAWVSASKPRFLRHTILLTCGGSRAAGRVPAGSVVRGLLLLQWVSSFRTTLLNKHGFRPFIPSLSLGPQITRSCSYPAPASSL